LLFMKDLQFAKGIHPQCVNANNAISA